MMELVTLEGRGGMLVQGRMTGSWSSRDCGQLLLLIEQLALPPGCQVVLDFSGADHVDYRAAPILIQLAQEVERRGGHFHIAGVSDYLRRIMELEGALDGREFIEEHIWTGSTLMDHAGETARGSGFAAARAGHLQDLLVPSLN